MPVAGRHAWLERRPELCEGAAGRWKGCGMDEEVQVVLTRGQAMALRDLARLADKQSWRERDDGLPPSLPRRLTGELFWAAQALDEALSLSEQPANAR